MVSQREARLVGGKVSTALTGIPIKYEHIPESEEGSSFSVAVYLVDFSLFPQRLLHAEVKESYLTSCRSRNGHSVCWKPRGVFVFIS